MGGTWIALLSQFTVARTIMDRASELGVIGTLFRAIP